MDNKLNNKYPWEIRDVESETAEMLMKYFTGKYKNSTIS